MLTDLEQTRFDQLVAAIKLGNHSPLVMDEFNALANKIPSFTMPPKQQSIFISLIGRRIIVSRTTGYKHLKKPIEYKILEVSPSQSFIKFQDINGSKFWLKPDEFKMIEILDDQKKEERPV